MSSDPLARSDIWTGVPNETEYDAVYAAVTATERGRWFLTEYANRNRHADTHLLVTALARIETAIHDDVAAPAAAASGADLTEMAAAIDRIGAAMAADRPPAPDIGAAAERIQDIAFGLRERAVDAAVCDALDAAVREISAASAKSESGGERAHGAPELLRDLAERVDDMIKVSVAGQVGTEVASKIEGKVESQIESEAANEVASEVWSQFESQFENHVLTNGAALPTQDGAVASDAAAPAAVNEDEDSSEDAVDEDVLSRPGLFDIELQANERFSQAVAVLAASLTSLPDETDAAAVPHGAPSHIVIPPMDYAAAAEPPAVEPAEPTRRWYIESPDFAFAIAAPEANTVGVGSAGESSQTHGLQSEAPQSEALLLPGPQDDPADLFESPSSVVTASVSAEVVPPAAVPPPQPQNGGGQTVRTIPRVALSDPLAGIRALSEEETIALFG